MTSISKSLVVFGVGLVVVWLLLPLAWAGARAGFNALASEQDRQLSQQVGELLQKNGVAAGEVPATLYERVEKARGIPAASQGLEALLKGRQVPAVSWFGLALIVSVVLFGIVAAVCCKVTMDATLVGVMPAVNYLVGDPLLHFDLRSKLDSPAQGIILLAAQIAICYLCGSAAASIAVKHNTERWKRSRRP
jgi:hypothetical protein